MPLFVLSVPYVKEFFNEICINLLAMLYVQYVCIPETKAGWRAEVERFSENYVFFCIGMLNGFHVYVIRNLQIDFDFKKRYSMTNLGLVGFNKSFL